MHLYFPDTPRRTVVLVPLLAGQPLFTATRPWGKTPQYKNAEHFKKLMERKSRIVYWQHYVTLPCCQNVFINLVCLLDTKYMRYTET